MRLDGENRGIACLRRMGCMRVIAKMASTPVKRAVWDLASAAGPFQGSDVGRFPPGDSLSWPVCKSSRIQN